ncbi:MAG TPA: hypothetical protein VG389_05710 [Myxococcota bacterium]|nr:hypothetical protein [Myxococcota bacterium]
MSRSFHVEHNLDIYPHTGRQCVGCIVVPDDDALDAALPSPPLAPGAEPEPEPPRDEPTSPAPPPPEPAPRPSLRVRLEAEVEGEGNDLTLTYAITVTLFGRATAGTRVVLRDTDSGRVLESFTASLEEGRPRVLKGTFPMTEALDLLAEATLDDDAEVRDEDAAVVLTPVVAVDRPPAITKVAVEPPARWRIRTSGEEAGAVRRADLASGPEEGVVFVRPDVPLDPPLRIVATGVALAGLRARAELVTAEGEVIASGEGEATDDASCACTVTRVPAAAFEAGRTLRVFARVTLEGARAETERPVTLVRIRDFVVPADKKPTQYAYDVATTVLALGTPALAAPPPTGVESMKRTPEHQLKVLAHFADERGIAHGVMDAAKPETYMPVLLAVVATGVKIAAPAEVTWPPPGTPGATPKTYHPSKHVAGLAIDFNGGDLARRFAAVDEIARYHELPVWVYVEDVNGCVHVEYPARAAKKAKTAKPAPKKPSAGGAVKPGAAAGFPPPALSASDDAFRLPEEAGVTHHVLGRMGHEEMLACVAPSPLPPEESPRGRNRRFRIVLFAHGLMKPRTGAGAPAWTTYYRTADTLFIKKKLAGLLGRMNAAGHNVTLGVLCDQLNCLDGSWKRFRDPAYFFEAIDILKRQTLAAHPDAVFEGISLVAHSGGGALVQNGWLTSPEVRTALRADDGEVVLLDAHYSGDGTVLKLVKEGGLATLVAHMKPVRANCARLAKKAACRPDGDKRVVNADRTLVVIETDYDHERCSVEWDPFVPHLFHPPAEPGAFYAPDRRPMRTVAAPDAAPEHAECDAGVPPVDADDVLARYRDLGPYFGGEDPPAAADAVENGEAA